MAEDKKSFVMYCDLIHVVEKMPDDKAGLLLKHLLRYVNDLNPVLDDAYVDLAFEFIKQQLKRDLAKYEGKKAEKSESGRLGNLKRWNIDLYNKVVSEEMTLDEAEGIAKHRKTSHSDNSPSQNITNIADSVSVSDSATASDNVKPLSIDNTLMSEIKISDVPENEMEYFNIANSFYLLFKRNSEEVLKVKWSDLYKTKYKKCIDPIRLLLTNDKRTIEELQAVYKFLQTDRFWMENVRSTGKLREKFDQLITKTSSVVINNQKTKTDEQQRNERVQEAGLAIWKQAMGLD